MTTTTKQQILGCGGRLAIEPGTGISGGCGGRLAIEPGTGISGCSWVYLHQTLIMLP
jgi:hypothetical protein